MEENFKTLLKKLTAMHGNFDRTILAFIVVPNPTEISTEQIENFSRADSEISNARAIQLETLFDEDFDKLQEKIRRLRLEDDEIILLIGDKLLLNLNLRVLADEILQL